MWRLLCICKSGLLSRIVQSRHSVLFVIANTALPTKTLTDFDKYVTIDRFYKANATLPTKTPTDLQSFTLMMASAQVVETSVNTNSSPSQDYTTKPDDHSNHNIDSLGFKPFTVILQRLFSYLFITTVCVNVSHVPSLTLST